MPHVEPVQAELTTAANVTGAAAASTTSPGIAALASVPNKLLIDGEFVPAASGKTFAVLDPCTGKTVFEVAEADKEDVDRAVAAARTAFDQGPWPRMSGKQRGLILSKLAELIEQHADELAALESLDAGKPFIMSKMGDVALAASSFRYFAGWADKISGKTLSTDGPFLAYTLHEPIGVVGQIIPWNFPLVLFAYKAAPALACGNCVVIKPAEQTPLTALRVGQLALEAGLPPGVLNVLPGYGPTAGAAICAHPGVDKLAFTGSTEVGRNIAKAAAEGLKPVSLELGGKSPLIVWKDANIDEAVELAHFALFFNNGQCCTAASRLFIHAEVYDEFVAKLAGRAKNRKVGDPFTDGVEQGPQVDEEHLNKILHYIKLGQEEGAHLLCGGRRLGDRGYFVEPTVFADVTDDMAIARDEIFGPVQSCLKFHTLEEVVARANSTHYGLAAGIISNDVNVINTISRSVRAGIIWVNCYNVLQDSVPFGGYKASGFGRDNGEYALSQYTQVKSLCVKLEPNQPWL